MCYHDPTFLPGDLWPSLTFSDLLWPFPLSQTVWLFYFGEQGEDKDKKEKITLTNLWSIHKTSAKKWIEKIGNSRRVIPHSTQLHPLTLLKEKLLKKGFSLL